MSPRFAAPALLVLVLLTGACGTASVGHAQAPGDSVATPPYTPAYTPPPAAQGAPEQARARAPRINTVGLDRDRFEFGGGPVRGYFAAVGTLGYRRFAQERRGWQQWVMAELTGTRRNDLTEGTASVYYLFRHRRTYRAFARVRPLLEAGPGFHLAVQAARLRGFGETPFHARAVLKTHAYAGLELFLSERVGLVVRGRMTVPNHEPFDYAQAAIFVR